MMATIVALVSLAERRRAAETAPPEEGPAKMPSTRARALMVPSASLWLMSIVSSTLSSCTAMVLLYLGLCPCSRLTDIVLGQPKKKLTVRLTAMKKSWEPLHGKEKKKGGECLNITL